MAYILIHTSSSKKETQEQALRLQYEMQLIGHDVEFSTHTHPARLIKKNYDVFHLLSDHPHLNLKDQALLLTAKTKSLVTVLSYLNCKNADRTLIERLQFKLIDAFSTPEINSLKSYKNKLKYKFILPLFPLNKMISSPEAKIDRQIYILKIAIENFNELKDRSVPDGMSLLIDATSVAERWGTAQARKQWRTFIQDNPDYQTAIVILKPESTLEFFKNNHMIVDLSYLRQADIFQKYVDWTCFYRQFLILTKNQASGFPHFWKHAKNCWISDFNDTKKNLINSSKKFFSDNSFSMNISTEDKINEISRLYSKLIHEKSLSYSGQKVSPS